MLYVMTLQWQPGLNREQRDSALLRRAQWQYPKGTKVVGEYWPASEHLVVVSIFEADDYAAIMEISLTWGDLFQVEVRPAVDDGLKIGPEVLARRAV